MAQSHGKEQSTLTATPPTTFAGRPWARWTKAMRADFLDHLAATCNVKASAAAIGVNPASVYALRRHDPAFVAEWDKALDHGYQLLETMLVGHALTGNGGQQVDDGVPAFGKVEVDTALRVIAARRSIGADRTRRGETPRPRATKAETDAAILKKLNAIEAGLKARP